MARPVFFHIGPDSPADRALERMFRANGHATACHEAGRLAEQILYAMGRDVPWRPERDDIRLFTGLWRHRPHWRPPLEAWRCAAFLRDRVPGAHFILTVPPARSWPLWRAGTDALAAHGRGLPVGALPGLWGEELEDHLSRMRAIFADDPRLITVDMDTDSPADLATRLAAVLPMARAGIERWPPIAAQTSAAALLSRPEPPAAPEDWARDVADFCLSGLVRGAAGSLAGLSPFACHWDGTLRGRGAVTDAKGAPRQITLVEPPGGRPLALAREGRHFKLIRAEGVINDILSLTRRDPVWIDMEDSRWFGSPQGDALDRPVLCHNRRQGAVNAVLWPLPDQHAIGLPGFDPDAPADTIAFEDKEDRVVWRGMISGSQMRPDVRPGPAAHVWLSRLAEAATPATRQTAWEGLCQTNRLAFVRAFGDHPDFDLGVVMAWAWRDLARDPMLAPYCRPRAGPELFRRYRYQLCLTGYDHGSNFISGLDQNGVLLAEEDGWQVFYSGRFRPWEHYIPLARHGADIEAKLAWARAHPDRCKAISAAARAEAAHLRDPEARARLMRLILDGLSRAR